MVRRPCGDAVSYALPLGFLTMMTSFSSMGGRLRDGPWPARILGVAPELPLDLWAMRAVAVEPESDVAVEAEHLVAAVLREPLPLDVAVDVLSFADRPAVFTAVTVRVVDGQELQRRFTAAGTLAAVCRHDFDFECPVLGLQRFGRLGLGFVVLSLGVFPDAVGVFPVVQGVLFLLRPDLAVAAVCQ